METKMDYCGLMMSNEFFFFIFIFLRWKIIFVSLLFSKDMRLNLRIYFIDGLSISLFSLLISSSFSKFVIFYIKLHFWSYLRPINFNNVSCQNVQTNKIFQNCDFSKSNLVRYVKFPYSRILDGSFGLLLCCI